MAEEVTKYWIEPGKCATHKATGLEMCVDRLVTTKEGERRMVKGVLCHWLAENGVYQKGMFMTMELEPCNK